MPPGLRQWRATFSVEQKEVDGSTSRIYRCSPDLDGRLAVVSAELPEERSRDSGGFDVFPTQHYPSIDIKLRNSSGEVAYVTSARLTLRKQLPIEPLDCFGGKGRVDRSYRYPLAVEEVTSLPYTKTIALSQEVQSNGVDFFSLKLSLPWSYVYEADIDLVYDETRKMVHIGPIALAATTSRNCFCIRPQTLPGYIDSTDDHALKIRDRVVRNSTSIHELTIDKIRSAYFDRLEQCTSSASNAFKQP